MERKSLYTRMPRRSKISFQSIHVWCRIQVWNRDHPRIAFEFETLEDCPLVTPFLPEKSNLTRFPFPLRFPTVWLPWIFSTDLGPWHVWFTKRENGWEGSYYFLVLANFQLLLTHFKDRSWNWPPFIPLSFATDAPPTSGRLWKKSRRVLWRLLRI